MGWFEAVGGLISVLMAMSCRSLTDADAANAVAAAAAVYFGVMKVNSVINCVLCFHLMMMIYAVCILFIVD